MPPYVVFVIYFNDISDFFSLAKSLNKGERKGSQFQKYQKFSFSHTHTHLTLSLFMWFSSSTK